MAHGPDITDLLHATQSGDATALDQLMQAVYPALRRLAAQALQQERPNHTLQPTALVHEVFLKLFHGATVDWDNRGHFFLVAARQMRHILISYARKRISAKRGGGMEREPLFEDSAIDPVSLEEVIAVDRELDRLAELDARASAILELRLFGGLSEEETAVALGISTTSVARDWKFARTWLFERLRPAPQQS